MRIAESELIINSDGSVFHLHMKPEELADNVILVGDPDRVAMISEFLNDIEFSRVSREFCSTTGKYAGKRITVISTGIGCGNIDIVMTELDALANIDFKTREVKKELKTLNILRIGTCGGVHEDLAIGTFVFSEISIGCDGVMNWYHDSEKYTLTDYEEAFKQHCGWSDRLPSPYFVKAGEHIADMFRDSAVFGMTISASGFYGPQGRVVRLKTNLKDMIEKVESFRHDGKRITNIEMEGAPLAGLAAMMGHQAGTICCVIANRKVKDSNPDYKALIKSLVTLALDRITR